MITDLLDSKVKYFGYAARNELSSKTYKDDHTFHEKTSISLFDSETGESFFTYFLEEEEGCYSNWCEDIFEELMDFGKILHSTGFLYNYRYDCIYNAYYSYLFEKHIIPRIRVNKINKISL